MNYACQLFLFQLELLPNKTNFENLFPRTFPQRHAFPDHIFGGLEHGEEVVAEAAVALVHCHRLGRSLGLCWVKAVAEFALGIWAIYVEVLGIAGRQGIVGGVEDARALFAQEVNTEVVLHIRHAQQAEQRRGHIYLSRPGRVLSGLYTWAADEERDVVVRTGQFAVGLAHHLAVVAQEYEHGVCKPGLLRRCPHKPSDGPVGVFHDGLFHVCRPRSELPFVGQHIGRMVADGQECGEEGAACLCPFADNGQGIAEEVVVGHTEMIDHLLARIVFLSIHFVIAVGAQEGVHIVVLRLVGHKEECAVASSAKHGGQPVVARDIAALHRVAFEDGGEGIERGIQAVVRMIAGGVAVGEQTTLLRQAVEVGRERSATQRAREFGRHRFHEHQHHVVVRRSFGGLNAARQWRYIGNALAPKQALRCLHSRGIVHKTEAAVFGSQVVEGALQESKHRIDAQLVEDGVVAEIGGAHLNGIIAHASANAEEAGPHHRCRQGQCGCALRPASVLLRRGQLAPSFAQLPSRPSQNEGKGRRADHPHAYIYIIRSLAQHHAYRRTAIFGPIPNGGVENLGEIGKVGDVGCRCCPHEGVKQAKEPAHRAHHPAAHHSREGSHRHHHQRQQQDIAGRHVVKPKAAQECHGRKAHIAPHAIAQLRPHGRKEDPAQHCHHPQCYKVNAHKIAKPLGIGCQMTATTRQAPKFRNCHFHCLQR